MAEGLYLFTLPSSKFTGAAVPTFQLAVGLKERGKGVVLLCHGGGLARRAREEGLEVDILSPVSLAQWGRRASLVVTSRSRDHLWAVLLLGGKRPLFRLWYKAGLPSNPLVRGFLSLSTRRFLSPLIPLAGETWKWLPGGVDTETFFPGRKGTGGMEVVMVARMKPGRGQDRLIKALARLEAPVRVSFRGGGETLEYMRSLARTLGVHDLCRFFSGRVEDYPAFLRRHHVLVYLALGSEATARTVLEAMASGLVVLASPQGPIPFYLGGWNPPLEGDLGEALAFYAWSPAGRKKVGCLNARRAWRFSLSRRVERFLGALEDA